jgi:hypothetical protein
VKGFKAVKLLHREPVSRHLNYLAHLLSPHLVPSHLMPHLSLSFLCPHFLLQSSLHLFPSLLLPQVYPNLLLLHLLPIVAINSFPSFMEPVSNEISSSNFSNHSFELHFDTQLKRTLKFNKRFRSQLHSCPAILPHPFLMSHSLKVGGLIINLLNYFVPTLKFVR